MATRLWSGPRRRRGSPLLHDTPHRVVKPTHPCTASRRQIRVTISAEHISMAHRAELGC